MIHTPEGDITQPECGLDLTVGRLLATLSTDHEGQNGANDGALLVGECGEPACCGGDFSVLHKDGDVELSWADPQELRAAVERFSREHPLLPTFPNELQVPKVRAVIPQRDYELAVLHFAAAYLKTREISNDPDSVTQQLFNECAKRLPEAYATIVSNSERNRPFRIASNE